MTQEEYAVPLGLVVIGIAIAAALAATTVISIWLFFKYIKFNRKQNSCGLKASEIARMILDENGLSHIKVRRADSLLFGNSYGHYFKAVRLRFLIANAKSVTGLALATEKSALAIMDKNGDREMKLRAIFTPIVIFGPYPLIPLAFLGLILDDFYFGFYTTSFLFVGLAFYGAAVVGHIIGLRAEKKAQAMAVDIMRSTGLATQEEIEMSQELYKLYNIEYILIIVVAILEVITKLFRIMDIISGAKKRADARVLSKSQMV